MWGWKFTATPEPTKEKLQEIVQLNQNDFQQIITGMPEWTRPLDQQLVSYINHLFRQSGRTSLNVNPQHWEVDPDDLSAFQLLLPIPIRQLQARFAVLRTLNRKLLEVLQFVDLSCTQEPHTLGSKVSRIRNLIFLETKMKFFNQVTSSLSLHARRPTLRLSRTTAETDIGK